MIAWHVRTSGVLQQIRQSPSKMSKEADAPEQRCDEIVEDVVRAHRDPTGRHRGSLADALRRMGQEALEHRGTQAGPDQSLRDMRVRGVELVEVGVRLPLFETEFNLPSKPIEPGDQVQRKR